MKTLLVLSSHPDLADAVRTAINPANFRVVHRLDLKEAEPLLNQSLIDVCLLDVEFSEVQGIWAVEKLRRILPRTPLFVFTGSGRWDWEEEAYLNGVTQVLSKPVRPRLLQALLERVWSEPSRPSPPKPVALVRTEAMPFASAGLQNPFHALEALRGFSAILTHSLCAQAMLKEFLLFLRELIGLNRAAVFLRQPVGPFDHAQTLDEGRRLRVASAIGIPSGVLEHIELSLDAGIGGYLYRQGRILRRESEAARNDVEVQKEFELTGAEVAVPVLDRENLVGVAVFDGRVTGEALVNVELELIFHLLEELGMAIKNIWLHDQLAANHGMLADILRQLSSACVLIGRDLKIAHANNTARKFFKTPGRSGSELEFSDLPPVLASKVYQVLKTGSAVMPFKHEPPDSPGTIFQVNVLPFQRNDSTLPNSVLLLVEDHTQREQLRRLELETANLRLIKTMADRMAHEINNALVPLSTHQQLLADKYHDPEFRGSLNTALADGVRRVSRLVSQMRFLARDTSAGGREAFPLGQLIQEAYQEARRYFPLHSAELQYENGLEPIVLSGERAALKHALAEIILNALQASPGRPVVNVRTLTDVGSNGTAGVRIEIQDNGEGFSPEVAEKVPQPFFTTRNVGLGLGLSVSQKIIERHHGKLCIAAPPAGRGGLVRVLLPLSAPLAGAEEA